MSGSDEVAMPAYGHIFRGKPEMADVAKEKWREAIDHLAANNWITPGRLAVADRYARAYAEYEDIYPSAMEEGPVRKGPNGGDVFNFKWSAADKLNERIRKLETKLRIDPEGNGRVAPAGGSKTAADDYLDD
jgi:phage terminase small subunit